MKKKVAVENTLVFSYLALRTTIGILGTALPFVVALGALIIFGTGIQGSLSGYYYTGMRGVFVGTLWAIGFFMLSYKGYERADNIAGNLACIFAVGISLFPTAPDVITSNTDIIIGNIHLTFAALFFGTLIYFCLFQFTKTDQKKPTKRKLQRNRVYRICGYVMAACIVVIGVVHIDAVANVVSGLNLIFWFESIAIAAFGVSWLTKGEAILKDE
jgi:hypothetical protein